jgi:hypothetical protein
MRTPQIYGGLLIPDAEKPVKDIGSKVHRSRFRVEGLKSFLER